MTAIPTVLLIFWTLMGAAIGSFLNVVADRLPHGGSLVQPPSRCPACERRLTALDMIPVLSYLALRGRCRTCGARIPLRVLFVELATAALFALVAMRATASGTIDERDLLVHSFALSVLIVVTVTDLEHGLILNRVIVPAIGCALVVALPTGWPTLGQHLAAGAIGAGLIALIIALVPAGMGWGDAKLLAFIGLLTGLPGLWFALFIGFVSGGVVGAVLLATGRARRGDRVPLGPFLALGAAIALLYAEPLLYLFNHLSRLIHF